MITGEDRRLGDYFTDAVDSRGCLLIATGDTTLVDAVTGGQSPISHPLFLHQDSGASLTGQPCGKVASKRHHRRGHKHRHRHHHRSRRAAQHRRRPFFTG